MFLESGVHFDQQSLHSLDLMQAVGLFSDYTKTCGIISYYTTFLLMSKQFLDFLYNFWSGPKLYISFCSRWEIYMSIKVKQVLPDKRE